jgi:hypothetical protein
MQTIRMSAETDGAESAAVTIRCDSIGLEPYFTALRALAVAMSFHNATVDEVMAELVEQGDEFAFRL